MTDVTLWGWHVFDEIVKNKSRRIKQIYILPQHENRMRHLKLAYSIIDQNQMHRRFGADAQGIVFVAEQIKFWNLKEWLNLHKDEAKDKKTLLIACDCLQDARNLGAIIRTAAAFGVQGLLVTQDKCAPFNALLAKAAAGALEYLKIISVVNLVSALSLMQENGFFVYALDQNGESTWKIASKAVLVLGQEGKGLRELTRKKCDAIIGINTQEDFGVLNVSVAAAIAISKIFGV